MNGVVSLRKTRKKRSTRRSTDAGWTRRVAERLDHDAAGGELLVDGFVGQDHEEGAYARGCRMITWEALRERSTASSPRPGRRLLYQYGPGLGFLATVRRDGAPRLHPVCPVIARRRTVRVRREPVAEGPRPPGGSAGTRSTPSPQRTSTTSSPSPGEPWSSPTMTSATRVFDTYVAQGTTTSDDTLFEFLIERVLHAAYGPRPSWPPVYTRWPSG